MCESPVPHPHTATGAAGTLVAAGVMATAAVSGGGTLAAAATSVAAGVTALIGTVGLVLTLIGAAAVLGIAGRGLWVVLAAVDWPHVRAWVGQRRDLARRRRRVRFQLAEARAVALAPRQAIALPGAPIAAPDPLVLTPREGVK